MAAQRQYAQQWYLTTNCNVNNAGKVKQNKARQTHHDRCNAIWLRKWNGRQRDVSATFPMTEFFKEGKEPDRDSENHELSECSPGSNETMP